jgi:hypothetical protein
MRTSHYHDKLALIGAVSGLLARPEFRWKWLGYGNYACVSCGAAATSDGEAAIGRVEPCSKSCPWSAAEKVLAEILRDDAEALQRECQGNS